MQVVLTRPAEDAAAWAQGLREAGHTVHLLPLLQIAPVAQPAQIDAFWARLPQFHAVMFVSANAVAQFFARKPVLTERISNAGGGFGGAMARAWATGPGTVRALLAHGVPAQQIDSPPLDSPQFDSEALWRQVCTQIKGGERILIVRGSASESHGLTATDANGTGRDWLAAQLEQAQVEYCVAYQRVKPEFTSSQLQAMRQWASGGSRTTGIGSPSVPVVWLFSSSEAIANLTQALPGQNWRQASAICTHPRIAQRARSCGFGVVCESRPSLVDVVASIESTR